MCWTRSKLGIVNLSHATQVYPWEPKPGVYEVRAVFPGGDTLTLSDHASREGAAAAVEGLHRLLNRIPADPAPEEDREPIAEGDYGYYRQAPSFVTEDRNGKLHFDDAADAAWRAEQAK